MVGGYDAVLITVGRTGLEHLAKTPGKTHDSKASGAESGAVADEIGPIDPDLQRIIEAWLRLPATVKASILAMIKAGPVTRAE